MLLLGEGGKTVYWGRSELLTPYLGSLGFKNTKGENPADFMIQQRTVCDRNDLGAAATCHPAGDTRHHTCHIDELGRGVRRLAIPVRLAVAAAEVAVARHERSDLQDSRTAHKVRARYKGEGAAGLFFSPPAFPGEARVAGGPVLPEERPRMTPPLLKCDLCLSVRCPNKKLAVEII